MRSTCRVLLLSCTIACCLASCAGREAELEKHQRAIGSAAATAEMIRDAWLGGRVAAPYARVALDRALRLLEEDRRSLSLSPALLNDTTGAALERDAEQLVHAIAQVSQAITDGDAARARSVSIQQPQKAGTS